MRRSHLARRRAFAVATLAAAPALAVAACSGVSTLASSAGASSVIPPPRTSHPSAIDSTDGHLVAPASLGDLLTYDYDNTRSGHDTVDPAIRILPSKAAWDDRSNGGVYAEPLVYDATAFVATQNDSVYAIAARTGKVLWHVH